MSQNEMCFEHSAESLAPCTGAVVTIRFTVKQSFETCIGHRMPSAIDANRPSMSTAKLYFGGIPRSSNHATCLPFGWFIAEKAEMLHSWKI